MIAVLGILGAAAAGAGWYLLLPAGWQALAVVVMDSTAVLAPGQQPFSGDPERYVTSEMELLASYAIAEEAAEALDFSVQVSDLRDAVELVHVTGTDVVQIVARADSAEQARDIANAVASTYVSRREEAAQAALDERRREQEARAQDLEVRLAEPGLSAALASALSVQLAAVTSDLTELSGGGVLRDATRVVDEARTAAPARPVSLAQALAGGAVAAGMLGAVVGVVREARSPRVVGKAQVESVTGDPVVAEFPHVRPVDAAAPEALLRRVDDAVRRLTARLEAVEGASAPVVVAVCSAAPDAGTSVVWSAMASWHAGIGRRVLAVSLDATGRSVGSLLGHPGTTARAPGDEQGGTGGWTWQEGATPGVVVSRPRDQGAVVVGDVLVDQPGDIRSFDVVLVDASSIVVSPGAASVLRSADHIVLAVPLPGQSEADLRSGRAILGRAAKADVHVVVTRP